jgi:hypothetical protein
MAVEEHGAGRQLLRFRIVPLVGPIVPATLVAAVLAGALVGIRADEAVYVLWAGAALLAVIAAHRCGGAIAAVRDVIEHQQAMDP